VHATAFAARLQVWLALALLLWLLQASQHGWRGRFQEAGLVEVAWACLPGGRSDACCMSKTAVYSFDYSHLYSFEPRLLYKFDFSSVGLAPWHGEV
jgi:hypothetical protein